MVDHKILKPAIFISHASSDAVFANAIKDEVEKIFAKGVGVTCTSSPGAIPAGQDWLHSIEEKLDQAQSLIVVVTPISVERPWLWFEIGATWLKGREGTCRIYPLCTPEIELATLPSPLNTIQALSMGKATDLRLLFEQLIEQFGFGNLASFRASNIIKRIPKYSTVKTQPVDLWEHGFYSGKYTGYADVELEEVIDAELLDPELNPDDTNALLLGIQKQGIAYGKLLHFRQIDQDLDLPLGTAKRLLIKVAARYLLVPSLETDHVVRFQRKADSLPKTRRASHGKNE